MRRVLEVLAPGPGRPAAVRSALWLCCVAAGPLSAQLVGDDCALPIVAAFGLGAPNCVPFASAGFAFAGPPASCGTGAPDPADVWFQATAQSDGIAIATLCGGSLLAAGGLIPAAIAPSGSYLAVWDGAACPPPAELECAAASPECGASAAEVQFPVVAGRAYFLQLGSFAPGAAPTGTLKLVIVSAAACSPSPPNDQPAGAIPLSLGPNGAHSTLCGTDYFTPPPATPPCANTSHDVWFCFTPAGDGKLTIEITGGKPMTVGVWDAPPTSMNPAPALGCGTPPPQMAGVFPPSMTMLTACGGKKYYVAVSDAGQFSAFMVKVSMKFAKKTIYEMGLLKMTVGTGPPNAVCLHAVTLDILHPGLPQAQSFPNGWFYGVPVGLAELYAEYLVAGPPFLVVLDMAGGATFLNLPAAAVLPLAGAVMWSVAVAFDPLTLMIVEVTPPEAFVL